MSTLIVTSPGAPRTPEGDQAPLTWVRSLEDLPAPAPAQRRALATATAEERTVLVGSLVAGLSLAWVLCFRLLPWGNPFAFAVTAFVAFLAIITVTTTVVSPGPDVPDRLAGALVTGGALIVGIALVTTVVFTFVRGISALPHVNMVMQDMAGVGPRDALSKGGVLHAIVGSLIQVGIAITVTVPLALGTAVFMTEIGGKFARVVRTVVEAMTALPSIVAGLFIYTVLLVGFGLPRSGFAAAMALSVMMLPIIARARPTSCCASCPAVCARRASRSARRGGGRCGTSCCRPRAPAWRPLSSSGSRGGSGRPRRCCSPRAPRPTSSPTRSPAR
jgi:phosphate transport system permease protein